MVNSTEQFKQLETTNTLWNKKLDSAELKFLKSQDKLLLNFKDTSQQKLLNDIVETNKISFAGSDKVRQLLNGFVYKPSNFIDQLLAAKNIPSNAGVVAILKSKLELVMKSTKIPSFNKQVFITNILLDAQEPNTYLLKQLPGYISIIDGWLIENVVRDANFTKKLHTFQQKYSTWKWWSEADCIIWFRTIQQLYSTAGIKSAVNEVSVDTKFSKAVFAEKDSKEYNNSKSIIDQIDLYYNDATAKDNKDKIKNMIDFVKKIQSHAYDNTSIVDQKTKRTLDYKLKYTATSRLMQYIQIILGNDSTISKEEVTGLLDNSKIDIKTYWNASTTRTDIWITKTDDYIKDLNNNVEQKEKNKNKIEVIVDLCNAWLNYYQKEAKNAREHWVAELSQKWLLQLQALANSTASDVVVNQEIWKAFNNIFFSTWAYIRNEGQIFDGKYKLNTKKSKFNNKDHDSQIELIDNIKTMDWIKGIDFSNPTSIKWLRAYFLNDFVRKIDKDFDGWWFLDDYKSGEGIVEEIENKEKLQKLNMLRVETAWVSIADGFNEYSDLNADLAKTNAMFLKISWNNPDTTILKGLQDIMVDLSMSISSQWGMVGYWEHQTYVKWELQINQQAIAKFKEIFGFSLSGDGRILLFNTLKNIKQQEEKIQKDTENQLKDGFSKSIAELDGDINFYTSEIEHLQNTDPNSSQITTYKNIKNELIASQNHLLVAKTGGYIRGLDPLYEWKTIKEIAKQTAENMGMVLKMKALEKAVTCWVIEKHPWAIDKLKKKTNKTWWEVLIDLYSNIKGVGWYISDETYNTIVEATKEIIIQIVICAVSAWVGGLIAKWVVSWTKWAITATRGAIMAQKFWKFYEIAAKWLISTVKNWKTISTAEKIWVIAVGTTSAVIEWTAFHVSSTILNNIYTWAEWSTGLDNTRGYLQSIAFLWVLKEVSKLMSWSLLKNGQCTPEQTALLQKLESGRSLTSSEISQLPKQLPKGMEYTPNQLKALTNSKISLPQLASKVETGLVKAETSIISSNVASWFTEAEVISSRLLSQQAYKVDFNMSKLGNLAKSMGIEMWSLMVTDQIISLMFDQKFKEITVKDIVSMVGMVIWLRALHKANPLNKINEKLDQYIISDVKRNAKWDVVDLVLYDGKNQKIWSEMKKMAEKMKPKQEKPKQEKSKKNNQKEQANENNASNNAPKESPKKEEVKVKEKNTNKENNYDNLTAEQVSAKIKDITTNITKIEEWNGDLFWDAFGSLNIQGINNEILVCKKNPLNKKVQERLIGLKNSLQLRESAIATLKSELELIMKSKNAPKAESQSTNQKTSANVEKNVKVESEVKFPDISFEKVKTFEELYKELDRVGSITSKSTKKTYTAKELKNIIEKVRNGADINYITRESGLRNKVQELLNIKVKKYKWVKNPEFMDPVERQHYKNSFEEDILQEYNWKWTEAEKLLDRWYYRKTDQIWLYNEFVNEKPEYVTFNDGTKWEYKLHISATEENFNMVMKEFGDFFVNEQIWAKCAPWKLVANPEMWGQYGKVFTVYARNKAEMLKVIEKAKEVYKNWYWGINKDKIATNNANLQYELPIEWTGDLVYYTIERNSWYKWTDWDYIDNYSQRIQYMKKYQWQWPLDNLVDRSHVTEQVVK